MGIAMQLSFTPALDTERPQFAIGRVSAHTSWRGAGREFSQADRDAALADLAREAEEYGADGVTDITFAVEPCRGGECEGVKLHRLVATGRAVRLALAA
jgi:uncharacterized protein YbjQ (UPF0145 family)